MGRVAYVTDQGLEEILVEEDKWVVVCFYARESTACEHFEPEFEAYSEKAGSLVLCLRMDVDENPSISEELLVEMVPVTLLFREGDEVARFEGPYSREALTERLGNITGKE